MSILNLDLLILGISIAVTTILGFVVYFNNRKSVTNRLFLLFTVVSSLWGGVNYISYKLFDPVYGALAVRLVMFFAVYQAGVFFLLTYIFPQETYKFPRWIKYVYIPLVIIVSIITLTPLLYSEVIIKEGSTPQPVPAPGMALFAIVAVSSIIAGLFILLKRIVKTKGNERLQFVFLLLGVLLMFGLILAFNFFSTTIFGDSSFVPLSGIFMLPFALFTYYAISRHELLNIKIIGTEIVTILLIVLSFAEIILSSSLREIIFRSGLFVALLIVGILLIQSVLREVKQKEQLQLLNKKLEELDKQKDEFVSMAAHELRSPLTAIKGYISMIIEGDTGDIPEKARQYLADSMAVTERLVRLVNNMLNVSRIEEGRIVYQMEETNLIRAVQEVFNTSRVEAERKGLEFKMDIPNALEDNVKVDPDRIREVVGNIVSNAIKYTEKGKVSIKMSNPRPDRVRVEVVDTGPGISKEEQSKLFQKFYRAESTSGKTFGTGLGLYITRLLIEKFGGEIGLMSELDKGSNFWFELPVTKKI